MAKQKFIPVLFLLAVLATAFLFAPGCANIIPPSGGPRDSLPPILLKASPENETKNFAEKRITLTFNEFVEVDNPYTNLIVSPIPKNAPQVDAKLNTVTVKLKDTLEENTTYTFDFGKAIKDVNEGNIMRNFSYTFSTGNYFDSLQLKGNVILAETGKVDSTLMVILHTTGNDSALIKDKPRYVTRLDSAGNFTFKNLPHKTFYLYALKDNGGYSYFGDKQLFAFADSAVMPGVSAPVTMYAFEKKESSGTTTGATSTLKGRKNVGGTDRRLKFQTSVAGGQQDLLTDSIIFNFEESLKVFDSSKIRLYKDSAFNPVTGYSFIKDSSSRKVVLRNKWDENTLYRIILDKDFATDSLGKQLLKTDTLNFTTKKKSDYASLKIKFKNLDLNKNPVLQFVQNESVVKSFPLSGEVFSVPLIIPGDYQLRILYDENKNGVWDPGTFFEKRKQPEIAVPIQRKITVRPSFQNDFDIDAIN